MKFLLFLGLLTIVFLFFFRTKRPISRQKNTHQTMNMVQCQHCGVHVPANEAISHNGRHWCSKEHFQLGYKE